MRNKNEILVDVVMKEYESAIIKFGPFNSAHEGYAIIQEEVDELWSAIKGNMTNGCMRAEAIQIAAMAIRFINDICTEVEPEVNILDDEDISGHNLLGEPIRRMKPW